MASRLRSRATPGISFFSFQDIITSVTGILVLVTLILTLYLDRSAPGPSEIEPLQRRLDATREQLEQLTVRNGAASERHLALVTPLDRSQLLTEIREWQDQVQALSNRLVASRQRSTEQDRDSEDKAEELGLGEARERAGSVERELEQWKRNNSALATESAEFESVELELRRKITTATNQHRLWLLPDLASTARQPILVTVSRTDLVCERFNQPTQRRSFSTDQALPLFSAALRDWNPSRDYLVFYVRPSGIERFIRCLEMAKSVGFQVGYDAVEENKEIVFSTPAPP